MSSMPGAGVTRIIVGTLIALAWSLSGCEAENILPEQLYHHISAQVTPELASPGRHPVGVRTLTIVNRNQLNVYTGQTADRPLVVEVWYPARHTTFMRPTRYDNQTRLGKPFSLLGTAYRDAPILTDNQKLPLVVISHGYTGYRTLMFYLGEHLASHGYIVAAIDHTDSTNADVDVVNAPFSGFPSTLYNRSRDQQFTLDYLTSQATFLTTHIDNERAGLIGYSMGGYGAVNTIGGCYHFTESAITTFTGSKDPLQAAAIAKLYSSCAGGQHQNIQVDDRWRAAVAISPWGNQHGLFDTKALGNIRIPVLYIAGEYDDISDYSSIKRLFETTGGTNTYLLTYRNARHNVAAHPAPTAALDNETDLGHYFEPAWDAQRLNAINKHFILAMMDCHIKQQAEACAYLQLEGDSNQLPVDGKKPASWRGFPDRYSTGLEWAHK